MIVRSKAPLRIGLAGGGTDIETFSNEYGGAVLNATIGMYAYCTIIPRTDGKIKIKSYKLIISFKNNPKWCYIYFSLYIITL